LAGLEEQEQDEIAEDKITFTDALQGLEATGKYMWKFSNEDNTVVKCNHVEK
jgi:hypothetical protein